MSDGGEHAVPTDPYLEAMKLSRKGAAVLKTRLALVKSQIGSKYIFAFEGDDDKKVYSHWFKKCNATFSYKDYEPFPCGGKFFVLQLSQVVARDVNDIGEGVYFFVDRDFDDLQGHSHSASIFMTEFYSIENYLVNESVLESVLMNEVQCHAEPRIRTDIMKYFTSAYADFLSVTAPHNHRLFLARKLKLDAELAGNINRLANVSITKVLPVDISVSQAIQIGREPTCEEIAEYKGNFESLDPYSRYRGKFALLFFMRWLQELCKDRNSNESLYFSAVENLCEVKAKIPSFDSLAAHSLPPIGLYDFMANMSRPVS